MTERPRTLGGAVRARRLALGLTQDELATRIGSGVRQSEVSRLERDRIALPRRARLVAIAAALDLGVGELLAASGWAGAAAAVPADGGRPAVAPAVAPAPSRAVAAHLARLRDTMARAEATAADTAEILIRLRAPSGER